MKAMHLYHVEQAKFKSDLADKQVQEPTGSSFRAVGLSKVNTRYADEENRYVGSVQAKELHVDVTIIERVMPSAFIRKSVKAIADEHYAKTGQGANKAMKAQWTEQFLEEHLPNAPLKETVVRVAILNDKVMAVGTSSAKLADDVVSFVRNHLLEQVDSLVIRPFKTDNYNLFMSETLFNDDAESNLLCGSSCKLYSESAKRKISFTNDKGLEKARQAVASSLAGIVTEMQFILEREAFAFTLTEKGAIKGFKLFATDERASDVEEAKLSGDDIVTNKTVWVFYVAAIEALAALLEAVVNREFDEGFDDEL